MALNDIQLNSLLLTDIFGNSLVEINEIQKDQEEISANSISATPEIEKNVGLVRDSIAPTNPAADRDCVEWKYLGEYKKNILLIVRYDAFTYLPDEQLNFLTSVLGACKVGLADIAILNIANVPSILYKDIHSKFKSAVSILFGLTPEELEMPVNFPEFQVQAFNGCTFLHTPVLEKLETDKILKSKLWVCLKRIFKV